ncbi:MAG: 5-(carboxyamino)imidazole ribonucleotide synthase [Acidobacteriota bacterium]
MTAPILPGSTLGVLGGGQLGRMFALAARRLGYRVQVLVPDHDTPTGQVADREVRAAYEDLDAVADFARGVDVVTFEFENVPAATTGTAARYAPVRPDGALLHTTQNRLREKKRLEAAGFPVAPHRAVRSLDDLHAAVEAVGTPAVLKTASWGYDGKGQRILHAARDAAAAWHELATSEAVLEAFVDFEREVSVVATRGTDGAVACFDLFDNNHRNHILDVTLAPADVPPAVRRRALELARGIVDSFGVIGVLCVEMFLDHDGELTVNELAPRPHNSGHLTLDACASDQFEQQVRAVCGLPLGDPRLHRPAAMANLLGDLWQGGATPPWDAALSDSAVKLHLYGKRQPQPGRKMGHLTALGDSLDEARRRVLAARGQLMQHDSKREQGAN